MKLHQLKSDPERFELFCELLATGNTRHQIADAFSINKGTVTDWGKLPEVQKRVTKIIAQRANRICRHTDTAIEKRLEEGRDKMSTDQLLRIRHEFAPTADVEDPASERANVLEELTLAAAADPELARKLATILPEHGSD